jgi:GNAT superfamily N-acetyltransferase
VRCPFLIASNQPLTAKQLQDRKNYDNQLTREEFLAGQPDPAVCSANKALERATMAQATRKLSLTFQPLTIERWSDLERLFGERGACGGCWCMSWRLHRSQYEKGKGPKNKAAFRKIVSIGPPPGVLAYVGAEPAGWCAVAPREVHARLENSRVLARVDNEPVWSITCFFVAKPFRRKGVSVQLLKAAAIHAAAFGARVVEGYPVEPEKDPMPDVFAWTGIASAFRRAGFKEVARRSPVRPLMRIDVSGEAHSQAMSSPDQMIAR